MERPETLRFKKCSLLFKELTVQSGSYKHAQLTIIQVKQRNDHRGINKVLLLLSSC